MASVLIISKHGDGVPLALRLAMEGHIVKMNILESAAKSSLEGCHNPSKVADPRKLLDQYDLVLNDMAGRGALCDELASKGKLVLGGGTFNDKLELDREYGEKVARSLTKARVPESKSFNRVNDLVKWLSESGAPQVVKPLGNKPTSLTLVSSDKQNRAVRSIVMAHATEVVPCLVQERVDGIEVSTEGWFDGTRWVRPFNHTIEKKRFMEGDKGCNTGCMGNVVWPTDGDKLTATVLEPLEPLLKKVGYIGPLDANTIATKEAVYWLEWTPRFGYEAIQAWAELLQMSLFDYLYSVATRRTDQVNVFKELAIAVRLSIPPYPAAGEEVSFKHTAGYKVIDLPDEAKRHVWLADVKFVDGVPVLAGVDGVIGCVTARGQTVRECERRAYRTIKNIVIHEDVQYRNDIGSGVEDKRKQLMEWGWIN